MVDHNVSSCQGQGEVQKGGSEIQRWVLFAITLLVGIMGIIGNGLVIYFSQSRRLARAFSEWALGARAFRHLNKVVRNLAITDFLFSIFAVPLQMTYWYLGKFSAVFKIKLSRYEYLQV